MDITLEMGRQQQQQIVDDAPPLPTFGANKYKYRQHTTTHISNIIPQPPSSNNLRHSENVPETTL